MSEYSIKAIKDLNGLIKYFSQQLDWEIDVDDFEDIEDISYDFDADEIGLKEEEFAHIISLRQLQPFVENQKWGIFCVEFARNKFEVLALRKILSGLVPTQRNATNHAVWDKQDLIFLCEWGQDDEHTIGIAHFEDKENGLPQIKMIYCNPQVEDFTQIEMFEQKLRQLQWPKDSSDLSIWRQEWSEAFVSGYRQNIQDSSTLTIRLAEEAHNIRDRVLSILKVETKNGYVHLLYDKFRDMLVHDMSEVQFADMYSQTVVYGLFSARCMDVTPEDFSANEAIECIPLTNPFLKSLMKDCIGINSKKLLFDELEINNVIELLKHTQMAEMLKDFNRQTGGGKEDPVIHFYEEFLEAYDKTQKVQRGVYYTPQPVVTFMVKAVDDILKEEFSLVDGLASTDTKQIKVKRQSKRKTNGFYTMVDEIEEIPRVQILDPSTGTGTFLRQVIIQIYKNKKDQYDDSIFENAWNEYVPKQLLPRITGFELMMAPYAVAHMKLAMILKQSGYNFKYDNRLQVYLTNTLEEAGTSSGQMTIFDDPLATEAVKANDAKKNVGINVVIGNPPYSGESANKNKYIMNLMEDYKKEPGGIIKLQERNPKWLNDDYVKFIRYAQSIIERAGSGVLSYICPHGFLDNPTFRGMRWQLLKSFQKIYVIDLHGNVNKHETCPDGAKDENVFDIQQGVCILLAIKKQKSYQLGEVYHANLYGLRNRKYDLLRRARMKDIVFSKVDYNNPQYCFIPRNNADEEVYGGYFSVKELMPLNSMGVVTAKDKILVGFTKEELISQVHEYYEIEVDEDKIYSINYRPFDKRFIYYDTSLIERSRENVMINFANKENIGLVYRRQSPDSMPTSYFFICDNMMADGYIRSDNKGGETVAPLYLYNNELTGKRTYNFSKEIITEFEKNIGLKLVDADKYQKDINFTGVDLFAYIYAVFYSNSYRNKFSELLKVDYPRIPYITDKDLFWKLVDSGKKLMSIHLMRIDFEESELCEYYGNGDDSVGARNFENNAVIINKQGQGFKEVSVNEWNAYLGGYQPLQKWMKDRNKKTLSNGEIQNYRQMIASLKETKTIQDEIDAYFQI